MEELVVVDKKGTVKDSARILSLYMSFRRRMLRCSSTR